MCHIFPNLLACPRPLPAAKHPAAVGPDLRSRASSWNMLKHGSVSKPCTPGEHQSSWDLWMFIPLKNGINRYWSIATSKSWKNMCRNWPCWASRSSRTWNREARAVEDKARADCWGLMSQENPHRGSTYLNTWIARIKPEITKWITNYCIYIYVQYINNNNNTDNKNK